MELFKRYAELQKEVKEKTELLDAVKEGIVNYMHKMKKENEANEFGKFTIAKRKNWVYTPAVDKIKEKLDLAKVKEQENGKAHMEVTNYLTYKANV